jgi:predicted 3-demethylubiquinone-9 3-methyltransferase (glyoxalase superfamily)
MSDKGVPLMDVGEYPSSKRYGWLQDRYRLFWQLMYMKEENISQKIVPFLLFVGSAVPQAEQCGWLKNSFGFSWQVVPKELNDMLANGTKEQISRAKKKSI